MKRTLNVDLTGKVAVITGAGGVLCSCMAEALAAAGAKTALLDINKEAADAAAQTIIEQGGSAMGIACDVLDTQSIQAAHEIVVNAYGPCDILINGAGGNHPLATTASEVFEPSQLGKEKTFFDIDKAGLDFVFGINFTGTFLVSQVFAKDMLGEGNQCIINIASVNTYLPLTKIPAYAAAKEAVGNLTKWMATYFSQVGVRVNAIAPGFLATHQTKPLFYEADGTTPTARLHKILSGTPMNRLGVPDELTGTILFLASEEAASFITGAVIPIDGGYTAYSGV